MRPRILGLVLPALCLAAGLASAQIGGSGLPPAPVISTTGYYYKEVYNSSTAHTPGGAYYLTDSLDARGARYLQFGAIADSQVFGGAITNDSLQVQLVGTNSFSTQARGSTIYVPWQTDGSLVAANLANGAALEGWWIGSSAAAQPEPMPFQMVRLKFLAGGTSANRAKNLRIWAIVWR